MLRKYYFGCIFTAVCMFQTFVNNDSANAADNIQSAVNELASDRDFQNLLVEMLEISNTVSKSMSALTLKQKMALLNSHHSEILKKLGVSARQQNTLEKKIAALHRAHPLIAKGRSVSGEAAFIFLQSEYSFYDVSDDPRTDLVDCIRSCSEERRKGLNRANMEEFISALGAFNPNGIVGMWYGWIKNDIDWKKKENSCRKDCYGSDVPEGFCFEDNDCATDRFCQRDLWESQGLCSLKSGAGKTCPVVNGHNRCLSGCCKYHALTNLVSTVCRPANKC